MAISRERKEELLAQYIDLLNQSKAIFLTEYTGIGVKELQDLRVDVRDAQGVFHITKNTLMRYALEQAGKPIPEEMLSGQTATGFALGEVPTLAKALVDFAEEEESFLVKGGIMEGEMLTAAQIEALAKLPTLDELRAQIIGLIDGPARSIVSTLSNGVRQVVNVIDAYAKSEETAEEAA